MRLLYGGLDVGSRYIFSEPRSTLPSGLSRREKGFWLSGFVVLNYSPAGTSPAEESPHSVVHLGLTVQATVILPHSTVAARSRQVLKSRPVSCILPHY